MNTKIKVVILAAGLGTRMKSDVPKALIPFRGEPMIRHVLRVVEEAAIDSRPIVVVGHQRDLVMQTLGDKFDYTVQENQLGTGHALMAAKLNCYNAKNIMVIATDQLFLKSETLRKLTDLHFNSNAKITFATATAPNFKNEYMPLWTYGRIMRNGNQVACVREFKDASADEKEIREVNAGVYLFDAQWLWANLSKIESKNAQSEYYLTDLFPIAASQNVKIETLPISPREALGANSKEELQILENL